MTMLWVHAEATDGKVATITLEMLAKARELAEHVGCVMVGDADAVAAELGAHGASIVFSTGDLDGGLAGPALAAGLAAAIGAGAIPDAILFGTTQDGRDIAGRLSVKLDAPVITNVVDLEAGEGSLIATEPIFGGVTNVKTVFTSDKPGIFLVRPKSFEAVSVDGGAAKVAPLAVPDLGATGGARVVNRHVEESDGPKLDEAAIVVSGGRGLGDAEKFSIIEDLAKALGGAAGASRAVVDAGWVPFSYQVGQTGKVVKPDLYIAAGISGATQHMVGMKGSKTIIAINKDSEAPIFGVADLGIVGDVHKVLPQLLEALANR
ncbi:MAG: electron transfer flavoprotein subunit alpha/FixB family protein [Acidimicrobiales bacterium]